MVSSLSLGGEQATSAKKGDQSTRPSSESNSRSPVDFFLQILQQLLIDLFQCFHLVPVP